LRLKELFFSLSIKNFMKNNNLINQPKYRKKILFLSPLPPPYFGSAMSSKMCLDILNEKHECYVKNIKLNYSNEMSEVGKIRISKIFGVFYVAKQILFLMRKFKPEIIYFVPAVKGFALLRDSYFLKIVKLFGKGKIILHLRGQFKDEDWDNPVKRYFIKDMLHADKAIVLGTELIGNLHNLIPSKDIYVLPNAIENTLSDIEFESISEKRKGNKRLKLLFISHLRESKGWFRLLEACKLLSDAGISYECHFIGEWRTKNGKQKYYQYVEKNKLGDNVFSHSILLGTDKNKILADSDILIFPTDYDAFPRVIIEAMEYGLPVISTSEGAIPSIIDHGKSGFIMEQNNADNIFKYVIRLQNETLRVEMGRLGREHFLAKFTLASYKSKFVAIIN
jgi:glycosyltransferase involved in cell wall biosynthesis